MYLAFLYHLRHYTSHLILSTTESSSRFFKRYLQGKKRNEFSAVIIQLLSNNYNLIQLGKLLMIKR